MVPGFSFLAVCGLGRRVRGREWEDVISSTGWLLVSNAAVAHTDLPTYLIPRPRLDSFAEEAKFCLIRGLRCMCFLLSALLFS